jgi:hypothetical protein
VIYRTLIGLVAVIALGCVPAATDALAAGHPGGHGGGNAVAGHAMAGPVHSGGAMGGYARGGHIARSGGRYYRAEPVSNGSIYDSCPGYSYGYGPGYGPGYAECRGYGDIPVVGGLINGIRGGYGY